MKHITLKILAISLALLATSAMASSWSIKLLGTPNGEYSASLIHKTEPAQNETVGVFKTKKEARQAAKAAKKEKDGVISTDCGVTGQPPCP